MMRVMSWNLRFGLANDGENRWSNRRALVIESLREHRPAILGLQEALRFQLDEILSELPQWEWFGGGRDDGRDDGEFVPILYQRDRFELVDSSLFWLSETPKRPGSIGWDARHPRVGSWVVLRNRESGRRIQICNVHLDHYGAQARAKGAEQVRDLLATQAQAKERDAPAIVMGDFNSGERDAPVRIFLDNSEPFRFVDSFRRIHPDAVEVGTRHDFTGDISGAKIDHLLIDDRLRIPDAGIDRFCRNGRYPSDHFAVWADIDDV